MPTYEWRDLGTGRVVEVERAFSDYNVGPTEPGDWVKIIRHAPCVPFETLRDKGVFETLPQTSLRRY